MSADTSLDRDLLEQAVALDEADELAPLRSLFELPPSPGDDPLVYLAGNSLGLMPRTARDEVESVLDTWANFAVDGHFVPDRSWYSYDVPLAAGMAAIVGAEPSEVAVMGALTENLHLLLASFYRPKGRRRLLVIEADAFPSDRYMATTHVQWHGLDPDVVVVELDVGQTSAAGFAEFMERRGDEVAVVLLGGVNYLDGRVLPMADIAAAAHAAGALVGFDLAHAAGNVPLALHDWDVDFASWCSYKYLNSGPGAIAALFVHSRHDSSDRHRLGGWWGNDPETRFLMDTERTFVPMRGASGFKVSNPSVLAMAPMQSSLDIFERAGGARVVKSRRLTAYTRDLLAPLPVEILTPAAATGAQTSIRIDRDAKATQSALHQLGVLCDMRPPNVLRLAPTALYNSFNDMARTALALEAVLRAD